MPASQRVSSKVRMGMIGGGDGAFIGAVHRHAAALDGGIELVCGAFSSSPQRSRASGAALHLQPERVYADFETMLKAEAGRPTHERMQFVSIVTPNHLHFPAAELALRHGFHVLSDKPATLDLAEALELREQVHATGRLYGLTHTYAGYPLIRQAREIIREGRLGPLRKILVEYPQGWLASDSENQGNAQAAWRLDPAKAGVSCCMGDIGVHAAHLAEFVSGLRIESLCADLTAFVPGRRLDDDGSILLRFDNGAKGVLTASQVCAGEENNLRLRIYGEQGGLDWSQQEPNTLWLKWTDRPTEMLRAGAGYLSPGVTPGRLPMGHPEGYIEAFANLYRDFAAAVLAADNGEPVDTEVPGIQAAVRGMAFIEHAVKASEGATKWHALPDY